MNTKEDLQKKIENWIVGFSKTLIIEPIYHFEDIKSDDSDGYYSPDGFRFTYGSKLMEILFYRKDEKLSSEFFDIIKNAGWDWHYYTTKFLSIHI